MNVMIVDDSAAMRMMIIKTLRQAGLNGHEFSQATDGAAALEAIRKAPPDVVLCDWNMPNMNGIDFVAAARAKGFIAPIVMVTTEAGSERIQQAKDAGANGFVTKPFTPERLSEALAPIMACA